MSDKKETMKFSFSVEGQTEKWYLEWLQNKINTSPDAKYNVSILPVVEQHPIKFIKRIITKSTPKVVHLCDIESTSDEDIGKFKSTLSEMKEAKAQKSIEYPLGYSNLTFELWLILHKKPCNGPLAKKEHYLQYINDIFGESFHSLDQYKEEKNFKRCLSKLNLSDVKEAINRADAIMKMNIDNGMKLCEYKGYRYYLDNPALTIWEHIRDMLVECGVLPKTKNNKKNNFPG